MGRATHTPLRPLGTAEILDGAVRAVRGNARAAFAIAVPLAVVRVAAFAAVQLATYDSSDATVLQFLARALVSALFGTVLAGLLAPLFSADLLGRPIDAGVAWQQGRRALLPLIGLAVIVAVAEEVGLVAAAVGGVWLWGIWAVAAPALVLERVGVRRALGRSRLLVQTYFWRVWGIRALRWFVCQVLGLVITVPFAAIALSVTDTDISNLSTFGVADAKLYIVILSIGTLIAVSITSPISAAVDSLLYADLRMRREGMDLVLELGPGDPAERPAISAW